MAKNPKLFIEKTKDKYLLKIKHATNQELGEMIGFLQIQIGLFLWKKGMDMENVKSALLDVYYAACEELDNQRVRILKERGELPENKAKDRNKLDVSEIMRLHREGWSNEDIAVKMKTLAGQIDYIIRKESEGNEEDDVCVQQVR